MRIKDTTQCPNCRRLHSELDALKAPVATLSATIAQLQEQLAAARKNSGTSSKPPSSDIVKPPQPPLPEGQNRRPIGGQPGHPKQERVPFPPAAINGGSFDHRLDLGPRCGQDLQPLLTIIPRVIPQVDIQDVPLVIQEHRGPPGWWCHCQKVVEAPLPVGIERGGLVGPRLTTVIASLKGVGHASLSTLRQFRRDIVGMTIARGPLAKIIAQVTEALDQPDQGLLESLPDPEPLNVDETGHQPNGQRPWTWCLRASLFTWFQIDPTRSAEVLIEVLGTEFNGVLGCDYFSADRRYHREFGVALPFGLAHLIRDVKYLTTLPDVRDRIDGTRLREALRHLLGVIHRREQLTADPFQSQLEAARAAVLHCGTLAVPPTQHSRNLAQRCRDHGASYFRFLTTPGIEPTHNLAEPAIRFVVIDRRITQGTRSEVGNRWCERIGTVIATCSQQGKSVFSYWEAVVGAWFAGTEPPLLWPEV